MPDGQSAGDSIQVQAGPLTEHEAGNAFAAMFAAEEAETEQPQENTPSTGENAPGAAEDDAEPAEPAQKADDDELGDDAEAEPKDDEEVEQEPTEPATPAKHKVKVRGEEVEVTLDELRNGYSRTADYTRDKQKLADERRSFEAEKAAVVQQREQYHAKITAFEKALAAQDAPEPDWDTLRRTDPDLFVQAHAAFSVERERRALIAAERERVEKQMAEDAFARKQARMKVENDKLAEKAPEYFDPKTGKQALTALFDYGQSQGYSPQELQDVEDHRALLLLRKAMLYDQQQAAVVEKTKKAEQKIEKVKTAQPGSSAPAKRKLTDFDRSKQRLRKSGSVNDAGAAFAHLFADD